MFKGWGVVSRPGNCETIKDHIHKNICKGSDEKYVAVMDWMSSIVQQKPERGPQTALVIIGKKGTGKNVFCEVLRQIIGDEHYCEVQSTEHLLGKFSAESIKNKLVTVADEAFWAGNKSQEGMLKARITNRYLTIEEKFMPQYKIENFNNLIVLSNEKWVVPVTADERRFLILEIGNDNRNDNNYFGKLIKELETGGAEALLHELESREIQREDWLRCAPKFKEAFQQLEYSMDLTTRFWWNLVSDSLDFDFDYFGSYVEKTKLEEAYKEFVSNHSKSSPLDNARFWRESYEMFPELKKDKKISNGAGRSRMKYLPDQKSMIARLEEVTGFDLSEHKIDPEQREAKTLEFKKKEKKTVEDLC
jgi:phage/plasmid-associated DNA primase